MPAFQKAEFCKESTEAFKKQRESCLKVGVRMRAYQREGLQGSNCADSGKIEIDFQNPPGKNMLGGSFKIVGPAKVRGRLGQCMSLSMYTLREGLLRKWSLSWLHWIARLKS